MGVVTPDADTVDVSGMLGPLLVKAFQNQDGPNLAAFTDGRVELELREPLPTIVVDARDKVDVLDLPDRMEDWDGELLSLIPCPEVDGDWSVL